jgi:hypothetical protein
MSGTGTAKRADMPMPKKKTDGTLEIEARFTRETERFFRFELRHEDEHYTGQIYLAKDRPIPKSLTITLGPLPYLNHKGKGG